MIINEKTLKKLRELINEETEYRSGPMLVEFFNSLGFQDTYWGKPFPSRWVYTDEKLKIINGTPELDKCIKILFSPINYIEKIDKLDNFINDFNKYLAFDDWKIIRNKRNIEFKKINGEEEFEKKLNETEKEFLEKEFKGISLEKINLNPFLTPFLEERIEEIEKCLSSNSPLSVIFLCGSTLEGILLGIAENNPRDFNTAKSAPKDKDEKVRKLSAWSLNNFIDVAYEVGFIKEDVKKYSHSLREFRNYIHPYEQMTRNFSPDIQSARISCQVLKAALYQIASK